MQKLESVVKTALMPVVDVTSQLCTLRASNEEVTAETMKQNVTDWSVKMVDAVSLLCTSLFDLNMRRVS